MLTALPRLSPGLVIVKHMPEKFTAMFADRHNSTCAIDVREARNSDRVVAGRALIAPDGLHMRLTRSGAYYEVTVVDRRMGFFHMSAIESLVEDGFVPNNQDETTRLLAAADQADMAVSILNTFWRHSSGNFFK